MSQAITTIETERVSGDGRIADDSGRVQAAITRAVAEAMHLGGDMQEITSVTVEFDDVPGFGGPLMRNAVVTVESRIL